MLNVSYYSFCTDNLVRMLRIRLLAHGMCQKNMFVFTPKLGTALRLQ